MNERVEEIYNQMFAPEPIPTAVVKTFEKVKKFGDRLDSPPMRPLDLALIAAIATNQKPREVGTYEPEEEIDTTEPDPDEDDMEAKADAEDETDPKGTSQPQNPSHGPTGRMDAPAKPSKNGKVKSAYMMRKMSLPELRVHAKEMYGFKVGNRKKSQIINELVKRDPL